MSAGTSRDYKRCSRYASLLARCGFCLQQKIDLGIDYWIFEATVQ